VVFSTGAPSAAVVLVGEQRGDVEDQAGLPFVGPAGRLLAKAMDEAGLPQEDTYLTNAVKHFRFTQRGKRRIHEKPDLGHLMACKPWLDAELDEVDPELVVVMGATDARSVLGPGFKVTQQRGEVLLRETSRGEPQIHGNRASLVDPARPGRSGGRLPGAGERSQGRSSDVQT